MSSEKDKKPHHSSQSDAALKTAALEAVLLEKGLVDRETLDELIDFYQNEVGPRNGAKVIAKAWSDPEYKQWLLSDATSAIASFGFSGRQGENMVAIENTKEVHNMVVCTLCSCYPIPVLGLPPTWYKSAPYRSRAVIEPRAVLEEFGLRFSNDVQIRVWDSTAELRYLIVPIKPQGTENWPEEKLAKLVNRDSMIGTGLPYNASEERV